MEIREILMRIGISANIQGFAYILKGIEIIKKAERHIKVSDLYIEIYENTYAKSEKSVERSIRHAVERAYEKSDILKNIYHKKPNNAALIYDLAINSDIFEKAIDEEHMKTLIVDDIKKQV